MILNFEADPSLMTWVCAWVNNLMRNYLLNARFWSEGIVYNSQDIISQIFAVRHCLNDQGPFMPNLKCCQGPHSCFAHMHTTLWYRKPKLVKQGTHVVNRSTFIIMKTKKSLIKNMIINLKRLPKILFGHYSKNK